MENKNIILNLSFEKYNKIYRNRRHRLLKYTKKQVEDFDKKYSQYTYEKKIKTLNLNNYLLKNRKWALIGDTYYEIPKAPRLTWFRNLSATAQIITCALLGGVTATAIVVPTVLALNVSIDKHIDFDESSFDEKFNSSEINLIKRSLITENSKNADGDLVSKLSFNNSKARETAKIIQITSVKLKNENTNETVKLKENDNYTVQMNPDGTVEVVIKKITLETYPDFKIHLITPKIQKLSKGKILVSSIVVDSSVVEVEEAGVTELTCTVLPADATNKEVEWIVSPGTGTAEVITVDNKTYLKGSSVGTVNIKAKAKDGGGATSNSVEFNVKQSTPAPAENMPISKIVSYVELYENKMITLNQFLSKFTKGGQPITSINDLVGIETTVSLFNWNHTVRIIGVEHDDLVNSSETETGKALLTFEFVSLITTQDSETYGIKMLTFDSSEAFDFPNSNVNKYLNTELIESFPNEIKNSIKNVKKETYKGQAGKTTYNCKLFPLSVTEHGRPNATENEGTIYAYYSPAAEEKDKRIHKSCGQTPALASYWDRTTSSSNGKYIHIRSNWGDFNSADYGTKCAISPCFCV